MKDFAKFEKKIGVNFKNKDILKQAFTHRSYINESGGDYLSHNERLEYLGDAVLELVVSTFLYEEFPKEKEGILTSYRSALVNTYTIAGAAKKLGMNDFLLLSKGEAKDKGRARTFILADVFEALLGAMYLDQGYDTVQKFIAENILSLTDEVTRENLWQDAKSFFQEKSQEIEGITPTYKVLEETGPDHAKKFKIGVFLKEEEVAEGMGVSKQEAEQKAAKAGLEKKGWK